MECNLRDYCRQVKGILQRVFSWLCDDDENDSFERWYVMRQVNSKLQRRGGNMLAVVVVLGIAVVVVVAVMKSGVGPDGLYSHIDEYKAMADRQRGSIVDSGAVASGPVVVVNYERSGIDDMMKDLPRAMRAEMHSDVETVVIVTRQSTALGGSGAGGVIAPAMNVKGSYTISVMLFDKTGEPIDAHGITKKSAITGAGAEGELRRKADPEMVEWLLARLGG